MGRHKTTQDDLAERSGLARSQFSKLLNLEFKKAVPTELLRAVTSGWPDEYTGQAILEAHLKDEVIRANHSLDEFNLNIDGEVSQFDGYLAAIQMVIKTEPTLREVIEYFGKAALEDVELQKKVSRKLGPPKLPAYQKESAESQAELTEHVRKQSQGKQTIKRSRKAQ